MRNDLKVFVRILGLSRRYWGWMALGALLSTVTVLANIGLLAVAGWFLAAMAVAGVAGILINYFLPSALIRLFAILRAGGRYLERLVTHEATFRLLSELRVWFYEHLEPLAPARLQAYRGSDLLTRIQADIDTLHHAYLRVLVPVSVGVIGVAVVTTVLSLFSSPIALLVLSLLLAVGIALPLIMRRAGERSGAWVVETRAALRATLVDSVQGMGELRVYGAAQRQAQQIEHLTRRISAEQMRLSRLSGVSEGSVGLCANFAMWGTLLIAVPLVGQGTLQAPELPMLALLVLASFEAVGPLPLAFQKLGETFAAARRIFELVDAQPQIAPLDTRSPHPLDASLVLRGVRLRYDDQARWALDGLDLELPAGKRVAVVGPTGAGKSSVVRVAVRFWEYQEGEIRLGGHDLRTYRPEDVRDQIAVVSQDTHLFNTTILENLRIAPGRTRMTKPLCAPRVRRRSTISSQLCPTVIRPMLARQVCACQAAKRGGNGERVQLRHSVTVLGVVRALSHRPFRSISELCDSIRLPFGSLFQACRVPRRQSGRPQARSRPTSTRRGQLPERYGRRRH
jgi:ATP-binding cassette subfamily C protein CydC